MLEPQCKDKRQCRYVKKSYSNGKVISSDMAEAYAGVSEVKMEAGEIKVVLTGGIEVPASTVTAVRNPG